MPSLTTETRLVVIKRDHIEKIVKYFEKRNEEEELDLKIVGNDKLSADLLSAIVIKSITNENYRPLQSVFSIIHKRYNVFAFLEYPYVDLEFLQNHSYLYGEGFTIPPRACLRLHFFSGDVEPLDLKMAIENGEVELIESGEEGCIRKSGNTIGKKFTYRGFCVLKQEGLPVARACIQFDKRHSRQLDSSIINIPEWDAQPFLTSYSVTHGHLLSTKIKVVSTEFLQEESHLGHCGPTSIWVATHCMPEGLNIKPPKFLDISAGARTPYNSHRPLHTIPFDGYSSTQGMQPEMMYEYLVRSGCSVFKLEKNHPQKNKSTYKTNQVHMLQSIYAFIESGFPVILAVTKSHDKQQSSDKPLNFDNSIDTENSHHVITLIGHSLPDNLDIGSLNLLDRFDDASDNKHYLLGTGIKVYYAHDESYGPYVPITFSTPSDTKSGLQIKFKNKYCYDVDAGFLIAPSELRNPGHDLPASNQFFWNILNKELFSKFDNECIVWRRFFTSGGDFKNSLIRRRVQDKENWTTQIIQAYNRIHLPKYIWVCEFSIVDSTVCSLQQDGMDSARYILGEALFDATSKVDSTSYPLAHRIGNVLFSEQLKKICKFDACFIPNYVRPSRK